MQFSKARDSLLRREVRALPIGRYIVVRGHLPQLNAGVVIAGIRARVLALSAKCLRGLDEYVMESATARGPRTYLEQISLVSLLTISNEF